LANARQHARLLKQGRIEEDLALAKKIQRHFLPGQPPRVPGFTFAGVYRAALEIGGDYYDFLNLPDNQIGIAVGDVSGKGVSAALCMAKLSSEARYLSVGKTDPAAILTELNAALYRDFTEGMFVTLVFFTLDAASGRVRLANAGHLPPFVRRSNGVVEKIELKPHPPLGVLQDVEYPQTTFELGPGDTVIAYTDGLNEAFNANQEQFGDARILTTLEEPEIQPDRALESLLLAVETFQDGQPQSDDLTIVGFGPVPS
jgi:sigma-B regulation protein RsbU (phosphoserine phosphatase)